MPVCSIIVPVFNVSHYLHESVDSILSQLLNDFELILVDDGSTDNSGTICDEYAAEDSRIRVIHQKNSGPSAARNAGLDAANGKYIVFADSDDIMKPNLLAVCVKRMEEGKLDSVVYQFTRLFESGEMQDYSFRKRGSVQFASDKERLQFVLSELLRYNLGWELWNRVFVRELIERYHIRFPDGIPIGEDLAFVLSYYAHVSSLEIIDDHLYLYRIREASIMRTEAFNLNLGRTNQLCRYILTHFSECDDCRHLQKRFPSVWFKIMDNMIWKDIALESKSNKNAERDLRKALIDDVDDRRFFNTMFVKLLLQLKTARLAFPSTAYYLIHLSYFVYLITGFYPGYCIRNKVIRRLSGGTV